jgi:hypothetical protein
VTRADFAAAVGQQITVEIVAAIDGSKYGYLHKIEFPNGSKFSVEESQTKDTINP